MAVSQNAANTHEKLSLSFTAQEEGFLYVYLSYDDLLSGEMYFDDLKITHNHTMIVQTDSYYPFGLTQKGKGYVREDVGKNRFLFNGKEEIDGFELGWYDYGARYYAPDIGKWNSIDASAENYLHQSPYHYAGNNPILFVDYDGNDYGLYINHETKSITIKATYYVKTGDLKLFNSAKNAIMPWNSQVGLTYKVGKGDNAVMYSIRYDLSVEEVDDPMLTAQNDKTPFETEIPKNIIDGSSNVYQIVSDSELPEDTHGTTSSGNLIKIKESDSKNTTGAHEIGHTLGLGHSMSGLMTAGQNSSSHSDNPTTWNTRSIILGALNGNGIGTVHSTGNAPKSFDKGKVEQEK